jgi:chloramphenicol-sensitive protein RarD
MNGNSAADDARVARVGYACALSAYGLWGFLPSYFKFLDGVDADLIVAHRIVWSVIFVGIFLWAVGRMGEVVAILRTPGQLVRLALSATVISVNWLIFVWAISEARVLEVSFGYFINPLVSVALGMVLLGERLTRWQMAAVSVAVLGIAVQAVELGGLPWVSLSVAFSFGFYGYLRKTVAVGASPGLMVEVLLLSPLAFGYLAYSSWGDETALSYSALTWALLVGAGVVTAVPLILFAAGARRLPMKTLGLLQYLAPSIQFIMAVTVYDEPLDLPHLISFVLIWLSLAIFSLGSYRDRAS